LPAWANAYEFPWERAGADLRAESRGPLPLESISKRCDRLLLAFPRRKLHIPDTHTHQSQDAHKTNMQPRRLRDNYMHPRCCNSLSKEEWKDSSSPVKHVPFLVCTANPCSTHGTRTPAPQGASGNHIPAIPPTPQPHSALSQTANHPSTSHRQISRDRAAVRTRPASITAHKLASIAWHPALLPGWVSHLARRRTCL